MKVILIILCTLILIPVSGQDTTMGLFFNNEESYDGYTLLSNNEYSYLIDNCGYQVNHWVSDYKAGQTLYLTEEGNLLRAGLINGDFDAGGKGGVFELYDWEGNRLWQYFIADSKYHAHHDMALLPNGNFLCLVWEKKTQTEAQLLGRKYNGPVWSESIWEIKILPNNQATIVWQWSIWDHLIQDYDPQSANYNIIREHPELLDINYIGANEDTNGDWLHLNGISYNQELDQIAISSRALSEIYVIDHSTSSSEAAGHSGGRYGKGGDILYRYGNPQVYQHGDESDQMLFRPHNIEWVLEGTWQGQFSIFNNEYIPNTRSQALIWNNPNDEDGNYEFLDDSGYGDEEILFSYSEPGFYSSIISGIQVLANDNLLLLEGRSGVITEINSDGTSVWSYIYPVNRNGGPGIQSGTPLFNTLFRALRYPRDYPGFTDKTLTPTIPIELSPNEYECDITIVSNHDIKQDQLFTIYGNPVSDRLWIDSQSSKATQGTLTNLMGQRVKSIPIMHGMNSYSLNHINNGSYIVTIGKWSTLIVVRK